MNSSHASDLTPPSSPNSAQEFNSEIDTNAAGRSHASPATPAQIQAFEELVEPFGIIDVARTGVAALQRSGA